MGAKENVLGKKAEVYVRDWFKSKRYWAFLIPKSVNGQPFDLIARKKDDIWFVDVKHLEDNKASFPFERIEPNQITSMRYAQKVADIYNNLGFIIVWERDTERLFFIEWSEIEQLMKEGVKSKKINELKELGKLIKYNNDEHNSNE